MSQGSVSTDKQVERLAEIIAERLDDGASKKAMAAFVATAGFEPDDAVAFVGHVDGVRRARHWRGGLLLLLFGVLLVAVGGGVTAYTYATAEPGGTYVVWWGLVVWGLVQVGFGFNKMAKKNADAEDHSSSSCMKCNRQTEGDAALCPECLAAGG